MYLDGVLLTYYELQEQLQERIFNIQKVGIGHTKFNFEEPNVGNVV